VPGTSANTTHPQGSAFSAGARPSGQKSDSYRHVPGGFPSPTPDESKTFLYYRDEVVPEPGLDAPVYHAHRGIHPEHQDGRIHPASGTSIAGGTAGALAGSHGSHGTQGHPIDTVGSGPSTAGPHQSNLLNKADPRVDSDLDGSRTAQGHASHAPTESSTSTGVPSGQHELRHTGSLEQPRPRSSDLSNEHHHGRDAAMAGGLGAGAAGLGYAATHDRDAPSAGSSHQPQESSPYSSKGLDPRALGSQSTSTTHHPTSNVTGVSSATHDRHDATGNDRHDATGSDKSTAGPHKSSLLNKLDPRVKGESAKTTDTTKHAEPESQHGRDAALVGGGAATAAGAHHALQRNDTPGAGTAVLPDEQTSRTGPLGSSTSSAPQHSANTSAPLSGSTTSASHPSSATADQTSSSKPYDTYHGPKTTSGSPFYGAVGAPAPLEDTKSHQPTSTSSTTSPATQQHDKDHHYGRDAGLAGAGVATAGGLAHASQREDRTNTGPASSTIGPHSSNVANVLDPRVQPDPSKQRDHTTTGPHQSDTLNRNAGHQDQHHYGRDAAVVGGTGAAGYGAYEAAKAYGDHRSTQPGASMNEQRYDTGATSANPANPVPASGQYDYNNDNTRRNVGLGSGAALGAGALGGAAYAGNRHADNTQVPAYSNQPLSSSAHPAPVSQSHPTQGTMNHQTHDPNTAAYPTQGLIPPQHTQSTVPGTTQDRYAQDPHDNDHTKRNAALLGTGAAAAGGAAYAHSQNEDAERERARLEKEQQERLKREQHDREKEQHKLDKEHAKQEKEAHKLEKEQHKHDKAVAAHEKSEHKHEKEQEKEAHRLQKEREAEAHRLQKERELEAKRLEKENEPEKKHGILGFLHRDKSKKEKSPSDNSPRQSGEVRRSVDNNRHSREYAAGGAALGAGTTAAAYDDDNPDSPRWKGKNLLHKDPPPGHPAREAMEHHEMGEMHGGKREHVGVDGPIGDPKAISGQQ